MTTTDRDGPRSNPYKPNPEQCCEACVFGSGEHAEWCTWCPNCMALAKPGCPFCDAILPAQMEAPRKVSISQLVSMIAAVGGFSPQ